MNYESNASIFEQIADRVGDRILDGKYQSEGRIPSVRDLAVEMGVNPNTVMRSFERLQQHGVIYNKRGIGYFVAPEAKDKIRCMRQEHFLREVLPAVFKEMQLLGFNPEILSAAWQTYLLANPQKTHTDETE
ncbi:MAG: GntR family transcriptional regulator [Tannerella sp.]|jgi:DNA-binding transcriptional regulator YhcF (GntR family)|nr:GntR family transcriptional regulator [Tannerella sp.]